MLNPPCLKTSSYFNQALKSILSFRIKKIYFDNIISMIKILAILFFKFCKFKVHIINLVVK
jgi:hypothetical protein